MNMSKVSKILIAILNKQNVNFIYNEIANSHKLCGPQIMKKESTENHFLQSKLNRSNDQESKTQVNQKKMSQKSSAYKTLFQYLVDKYKDLVGNFILEQAQTKDYLKRYLKKTLNNEKVDKIYYLAIDEFKSLLTQKINKDWESLSEDKKAEYNEIASEVMNKATHSNEYLGRELQGTDMLKLDVLSLFLQRNRRYRQACRRIISNFTLPFLVSIMFDLENSDATLLMKKFDQVYNQLVFEFQEKYEEIINLYFVVELKFKANNYRRRERKSNYINFDYIELLHEHLEVTNQSSEFKVKFSFCELAYDSNICSRKVSITEAAVSKKSMLMENLQNFLKLPSLVQMKQQLIKLAEANNASVCILNEWLQIIRNPQSLLCQSTFSKELFLQKELYKFQWILLIDDQCLDRLSKISGQPLNSNGLYLQNKIYYTTVAFGRLAIRRSQLLSKVLSAQLKLETRKPVFFNKFQFCYKDIVRWGQANVSYDNSEEDLKATLVLGVLCSSVISFHVAKGQLSKDHYCSTIKDFIVRLSKCLCPINIVMRDEFLLFGLEYCRLRQFAQYIYETKIFLTNEMSYFSDHLHIQHYLLYCLRSMKASITVNNFHVVVEKMIINFFETLDPRILEIAKIERKN